MRTTLWVLIAMGALVAGCLGASATLPPPVMPVQCVGIPAQTCQQIVNDARKNADPGTIPLQIRAVCTGSCTPAAGNVQVDILYSNNRRDSYGMGWSGAVEPAPGGPAPAEPSLPVEPVCQGVPAGPCRDQAISGAMGGPGIDGAPPVVRIEVRCTSAPCTESAGSGDTLVTRSDGSTSTSSWSYAGSAPDDTPMASPGG